MRWERLFDDVEAQLEAADRGELAGEVADRTRREVARLILVDRLRAARGAELTVVVAGPATVSGRLAGLGPGWLLLATAGAHSALVLLPAVQDVTGLPAASTGAEAEGPVAARLDVGHALRAIARDRAAVTVLLGDGRRLSGTLDRVGADFVDLAEHAVGEPRRSGDVRSVRTVRLAAIAAVLQG